MFKGIGASAGIGIGRAVLIREPNLDYSHATFAGVEAETARLSAAMARFIEKTQAIAQKMEQTAGQCQREILLGQIMMIEDPFFADQMREFIRQGQCAEAALDNVCQTYIAMFASMEDELMRQRAADVRDIRNRILMELLGQEAPNLSALPSNAILVARDLPPSMAAKLGTSRVAGILLEVGGTTSHSAILVRTMKLPAVLSAAGVMNRVTNGDTLVVDGSTGVALLNPDAATLTQYQTRRTAFLTEQATLRQYAGQPTATADGHTVALYGSIGNFQEARQVMAATGEGIGLFRTEFLFMNRNCPPTEEEQFQAYRQVGKTMAGREVIIRTLDVGGDKDIPYLGLEKEDNPCLGFRAMRYCLKREDVFRPQLRALLRASVYGNLNIMLPLVTGVEELRRSKAIIAQLMEELKREGIPYNQNLKVGVMIETPAAALTADLLAREADFFSIGTNDLTQYIMAADRNNPWVAGLGVPFQPAVLRTIDQVIQAGHQADIPVGMCGEAAADSNMIPLLLSMGLDEFSVSPSTILQTRETISKWTIAAAKALHHQVMSCTTLEEVLACLQRTKP